MSAGVDRFSVRGLEIAYHTWGAPTDFPIVMLHGFMDHGLAFAPTVRAMKERFFVVAPDHRGHGMSGWVGDGGYYYFQDYFQDVVLLVEHLGLERFGLVGHSMGGSIATGVGALLANRVEAIVLIEGMGPPFHEAADAVGRLQRWLDAVRRLDRRRVRVASVEDAADRLIRVNPRLDRAIALELARSSTIEEEDGVVSWRMDPLHRTASPKAYLREETEPMWRALTMPVLSLYGSESPFLFSDMDERHALLPNSKQRVIEGAGHNIHHERPALIAQLVTDWMVGRRDLPVQVDRS